MPKNLGLITRARGSEPTQYRFTILDPRYSNSRISSKQAEAVCHITYDNVATHGSLLSCHAKYWVMEAMFDTTEGRLVTSTRRKL